MQPKAVAPSANAVPSTGEADATNGATQIPINDGANSHSKNLSISALDCLAFSLINNTP